MEIQEILEYNKRCAEFLNLHRDEEVVIYNMHSYCYDLLKFHSDWNWIMEVKNQICNSPKVDEFNTSYDSVANGYHCEILPAHNNTFEPFRTRILPSEREAVVIAINQFLIWFKQNKTK